MSALSLTGFILGLIFPVGKISQKTAIILITLLILSYIVAVTAVIYSINTQPNSGPTKFNYSDPKILVAISAIGTLFYFWQGIISYGGGVVVNYIIFFIKSRITSK